MKIESKSQLIQNFWVFLNWKFGKKFRHFDMFTCEYFLQGESKTCEFDLFVTSYFSVSQYCFYLFFDKVWMKIY